MEKEAPASEDYVTLYRQAFEQFGAMALWNVRQLPDPSPEDALAITRSLRIEGNMNARRLAEQIERAGRAAQQDSTLHSAEKVSSAVDDYVTLYRQAFERFGAIALWNKRRIDHPEPGHALVIARALRIEGDLEARRLAEKIEQSCRAANKLRPK